MKASIQWLNQWVNIADADINTISAELTLRGLEIESIEPASAEFTEVYVGQVVECERHPNADKLSLCKVNTGDDELSQIICGASNVRTGLKVAVAKVGAVLPGIKIKRAKLRGIESCGMLCSEVELGLAENSDGIMELPEDAPIGTLFKDFYKLNDQILDVSITPNRGDCASILGIAREIAIINQTIIPKEKLTADPVQETRHDQVDTELQNAQACPKYISRVIKNINSKAKSPIWLTECLRRAGLRSINPVVDITNFVMLELGQPMHGFDLNKIENKIVVRNAQVNEKIKLLDETELELDASSLVIADSDKALALAGVMGGLDSGVTNDTKDILLESAYFDPETIAYSARKYQLQSDSSYRFERAVDPEGQLRAIEKATKLILDIAGGEAGIVNITESEEDLPKPKNIKLRFSRVNQILGTQLESKKITEIFQLLSMDITLSDCDSYCTVTPPSYRNDLVAEIDLIEEVLRLIGCDAVEEIAPKASVCLPSQRIKPAINMENTRAIMQQQGFREIISYSFVNPKLNQQLNPDLEAICLANPISKDMAEMRTSLWPGLVGTALYNIKRQQTRVKLFEYGLCFSDKKQINQDTKLAGLVYGDASPEQWGITARKVDFYDLKMEVEALLSQYSGLDNFEFIAEKHPALHPGQSARLYLKNQQDQNKQSIGWIGVLHPSLVQKLKFKSAPALFELDIEYLANNTQKKREYRPISKFPELRRDLAFILDKEIYSADVINTIKALDEESLLSVDLFDYYQGEAVPEGKKSLAISLTLQDFSKTLVDEDVANLMKRVVSLVESTFGATLRD